jgi:hypothetical protein
MVALVPQSEDAKLEKKTYLCPKCKSVLDYRIHRSFFVKTFLFFLPIKRYNCYHCKRKPHVWG